MSPCCGSGAPTWGRRPGKDTVLVPLPVSGGARHVQQDQLGILGLVKDDAVELHGRVHPPHVGLVPVGGGRSLGTSSRGPGCRAQAPPCPLHFRQEGRVKTDQTRHPEHPRHGDCTRRPR